jgi:hypothetical protein
VSGSKTDSNIRKSRRRVKKWNYFLARNMACAAATRAALARLVQAQALAPESVRWIDPPPTYSHLHLHPRRRPNRFGDPKCTCKCACVLRFRVWGLGFSVWRLAFREAEMYLPSRLDASEVWFTWCRMCLSPKPKPHTLNPET